MKARGRGSFLRVNSARLILAGIALFFALLFYVWSRFHAVHWGYEVSRSSQLQRQLLEEARGLTLELNRLSALERVEVIARRKMGLTDARADQIVYVTGVLERGK